MALWVGAGGLGALVFVLLLMWLVVHNDDLEKAPAPQDDQAAQEMIGDHPPSMNSEPDKSEKKEKPEKPPPLNQ